MIYFLGFLLIFLIVFYVRSKRQSREDGKNEQLAETAVEHSEETRSINEMENRIDEDFDKKRPKTLRGIRDFFKRGG